MKTMKKTTAAIALAATAGLVAGPMVGMSQAWAAEAGNIEITVTKDAENGTATYNAYQIFKATVEDGNASSITWANDTAKSVVCTALNITIPESGEDNTAQEAAEKIADLGEGGEGIHLNADDTLMAIAKSLQSAGAPSVASEDGVASVKDTGYYLIVTGSTTGKDVVATAPIYALVGGTGVTVTEKVSVPTVTKKVTDDAEGATPGDKADAEIGQKLVFTLDGTLPSNYDSFDNYYYAFHDSFTAGQFEQIEAADVEVFVDGTKITEGFTVTPKADGLDVVFTDIKGVAAAEANSHIVVTYKARLAEGAALGTAEGNENQVYIEYTKNPTKDEKGESTPDEAKVYSYALKLNKVDFLDRTQALKGAEFTFTSADTGKVFTGTTDENGVLTIEGLDAGTYNVKETTAPDGYQAVADFAITITSDMTGETPTVTTEDIAGRTDAVVTTKDGATAIEVQVADKSFASLPVTGQIGISIICIAGGILVCAAGIGIARSRRQSNED